MNTNYINCRINLEEEISCIVEKNKIEVRSILDIGKLWETKSDFDEKEDIIYKILSDNGIEKGEIVFQKVSVFKCGENLGFIDLSSLQKKVNQKDIISQFNISGEGTFSKSKCRMAKNEEEIKDIMGVRMNSGIIMPFTTNKNSIVMIDGSNRNKLVDFRTSQGICNIIKYEDLLRIYKLLGIKYFEYNI